MKGDVLSEIFTPTAGAATELPALSVAIAEIEATPEEVGVQLTDQTPLVTPVTPAPPRPAVVPLTNTWMLLIEPSASVAVPEMVVVLLAATKAPLTGVRMPSTGGSPICPVRLIVKSAESTDWPRMS